MATKLSLAARLKIALNQGVDAVSRNARVGKIGRKARAAIQNTSDALESRKWPARPQTLNFEITATCDAACIHCPRHDMDRPQKAMGLEIFRKIIDEAAALRIPNLAPNGFGEILTIRNLEEYLAYIRSKRHRFKILLNSNGYRMDIEKQELFLKYEVDFINITLDGATAETFESIRHKLKLAPIEANIRSLLALRQARGLDYPRVRVGMIAIPQNAHEGAMLIDKWKGVADLVGIGGFTNRGGSLDHRFTTPAGTAAGGACILPFKELNVWADGKAVLCCDDWNEEETVGDVRQNTLSEIWHGAGLRRARQAHLEGRGHEIAICSKCSMWRQGSHGARLWNA